MKKTYIVIFAVILLLSGCAKKAPQENSGATPSPTATAQTTAPKVEAPSTSQAPKSSEGKSTSFEEFQKLNDELEKTTDETKRRELLDKIDVILKQAEGKE